MKLTSICIAALLVAASISKAECDIGTIWQPMSLLGTEGESAPLAGEPAMAVSIVSRPTYISGAQFESVVAALALPHKIAGAPASFPSESNLVVLLKTKIAGRYRPDKSKEITIDLSGTPNAILKQHGIDFRQYTKLLLTCLGKNLKDNNLWIEQGWFELVWRLPPDSPVGLEDLPKRIGSKA